MTAKNNPALPFRSQWILRLLYERGGSIVGFGVDDQDRIEDLAREGLVEVVDRNRTDLVYAKLTDDGSHYIEQRTNGA